jgi:DNA-binding transcriptional regulator/RsmH inhibitor MraZ
LSWQNLRVKKGLFVLGEGNNQSVTRVKLDSSGRLYLLKDVREDLGKNLHAVRTDDGLRLVPVPENPVKDLRERTSEIRDSDKSVEELRREAREHLLTCS